MTADLHREVHNDPGCDEHAHCVCGGLMSYNADTGTLVCDDCRTDALVDHGVSSWHAALRREDLRRALLAVEVAS